MISEHFEWFDQFRCIQNCNWNFNWNLNVWLNNNCILYKPLKFIPIHPISNRHPNKLPTFFLGVGQSFQINRMCTRILTTFNQTKSIDQMKIEWNSSYHQVRNISNRSEMMMPIHQFRFVFLVLIVFQVTKKKRQHFATVYPVAWLNLVVLPIQIFSGAINLHALLCVVYSKRGHHY